MDVKFEHDNGRVFIGDSEGNEITIVLDGAGTMRLWRNRVLLGYLDSTGTPEQVQANEDQALLWYLGEWNRG